MVFYINIYGYGPFDTCILGSLFKLNGEKSDKCDCFLTALLRNVF